MKNEKLLLWEQRIKDCRNSKLSVASWCAQHQISQATYYYWHKKVTHKNNFDDNMPPVLAGWILLKTDVCLFFVIRNVILLRFYVMTEMDLSWQQKSF